MSPDVEKRDPSKSDASYASQMPEIEELARWINERARETLTTDGEHALMFFLVGGDGQVRAPARRRRDA
jgi:hypothetical protein